VGGSELRNKSPRKNVEGDVMTDECVVAVYGNLDKAHESIQRLIADDTPADRISLVTLSLRDKPEVVEELRLSDDSLYDAAVSAGLGGVIGVLTGLSAMVLSGGILFFVGPLYGGIVGGLTGGFIGAMSGSGVHEHQVHRYEGLLKEGKMLVIVNGDPMQLTLAHRVLEQTQPIELHTYARAADEEVAV
jgi:hypothetical protein